MSRRRLMLSEAWNTPQEQMYSTLFEGVPEIVGY